MSLPSHSLPYATLVKKLLQKEALYDDTKEEVELGQELDPAIIQKLRHSETSAEQQTAHLPANDAEESGVGNSALLHRILAVLTEIRDLLKAQRP